MSSDVTCDLELALLIRAANGAYHEEIEQIGSGYTLTTFKDNFNSGFKYAVYQNGNNIILSFAGTDADGLHINGRDLAADLVMGIGVVLFKQAKEAIEVYAELRRENSGANITLTGHSLGGSIAQIVGAISGVKTTTFNPYGTKHLFRHLQSFGVNPNDTFENITNYKTSNDLLYNFFEKRKSKNNPGVTYIVPDNFTPEASHSNLMEIPCGKKIPSEAWEEMQNLGHEDWVNNFDKANGAGTPGADPILVDLNGDGVIGTTSVRDGVYFDHGKDGFRESSAWVDENDGILVIDKNGNGVIDNGSEVFGDNYIKSDNSKATSGFDALKDLDSNNDGIINSEDESFSQIKILKGDGTLLTLEEAGITSINLDSTSSNTTDENGNTLVSSSTFTKSDGTTGSLGDFNLIVNKMDSFAVNWVNESEEVSKLPDILGCGTLYSLHQAMMRDKGGWIQYHLNNFINTNNEADRKTALYNMLLHWTGAYYVNSSDGGYYYDGKKLWIIEKFVGEEFIGVNNNGLPNHWAKPLLDNVYDMIYDYVYYSLMIQCDEKTKSLYELIGLEYSFDDEIVRYNFDKVIGYVDSVLSEDEGLGKTKLLEVNEIIQAFGLNNDEGYSKYYEHFAGLGEEYKTLLDIVGRIGINGSEGNDSIEGTVAADAVFGGSGNDTINTRQGDDVVFGGDGNDVIDVCDFGYCYYLNRNKKRDLKVA